VPQKRSDRLDRKNVDNQKNDSGFQGPLLFFCKYEIATYNYIL
jgi:hypothetical protein